MKGILFLSIFVTVYSSPLEFLGDLPMQNPDLFGGDILGMDDEEDRNAVVDKRQLWPNGIVPYELDPSLRSLELKLSGAIYMYKKDTCIQFIKRTNETDYVRLFPGKGCYSHVGRVGGAQPLSLAPGCHRMGTVIHELLHAIGFYHEQNRSDRDDYITIYWENIMDGLAPQFFKLKPHQNDLITVFDYESIMLYGEYSFSKEYGKLKTMVAKQPGVVLREVNDKYRMSPSDIQRINLLYKCNKY